MEAEVDGEERTMRGEVEAEAETRGGSREEGKGEELVSWSVGWLVGGWVVGQLVEWLVGGWSVSCSVDWSDDQTAGCSVGWWLVSWWLVGQR